MRAMVLAAGYGTRLRPLTEHTPKPLIPLFDRPLFSYHLTWLAQGGIEGVVMNAHHRADRLIEAVSAEKIPLPVEVVQEPQILGSGGGIGNVRNFFEGRGSFLVMNGDILIDLDLRDLVAFHRKRGGVATMVLRPDPDVSRFGAIGIEADGRVRRIVSILPPWPGPLTEYIFTGIHLFEEAIFDFIEPGKQACIVHDVYPRLFAAGLPVYGFVTKGFWADLGTPRRYLEAHFDLLRKPTGVYAEAVESGRVPAHPSLWIGRDAFVPEETRRTTDLIVGAHARIGSGARLSHTLVWAGSEIPAGVSLDQAIVTPHETIPL
ncbi:MAG: NDP-sugar synthase [Deltaproteobacteria bacterium]|nr:MAG: NDP-sugar synthase [Deltaproteobacteria bacterium]